MSDKLRRQLVATALSWQQRYGVAPAITSALSEYDAARLVGMPEEAYSQAMQGQTAVQRGYDFIFNGARYQIKANRPSGKPGSRVTRVSKPRNDLWDYLIWILYDSEYRLQEAWLWDADHFRDTLGALKRLSPDHLRKGKQLR